MFPFLESINNFIWSHLAFLLIAGLGLYFSIRSRFFQIRKIGTIFLSFLSFFKEKSSDARGIHPLKAFFAAIGGCIGIGNIVGICTAVEIGGPGALFWTWIGGIFGMLIQYAEVYLGLKYRVQNKEHNYDGGPMYFLPIAYGRKWIAPFICFLLCVYGVELFMFNVVADSLAINWGLDLRLVVGLLLALTIGIAIGGIGRVGEVCSAIIPFCIVIYFALAFWVLIVHFQDLPQIFASIFQGAFTTQAASGAFIGSSVGLSLSMGLSRGAYSGDIGVGYTSIIYAESQSHDIKRLASLTIIGIFLDTFVICTMSILVVLATGLWNSGIDVSLMVQESLSRYFPYMNYFMPFFLFLLGFTTILSYFVVGIKCAKFLSPKFGPPLYYLYACLSLPLFAFTDSHNAFLIMSLSGALLLIFNLYGIFLLRKEIDFDLKN